MNEKTRQRFEARAKVAKAMAHASRLFILDSLQSREMCVGELTEAVGADQSTVSKHLVVLREAGLIAVRKEGAQRYYRLACDCLGDFFCCIDNVVCCDVKGRQKALP